MPYSAHVSFCRDVRAFSKLEYIIFLSSIQSDGEEYNGKKNKGNKSWLSQTSFETDLLKIKLDHGMGCPTSSYSICSSPLCFDFL